MTSGLPTDVCSGLELELLKFALCKGLPVPLKHVSRDAADRFVAVMTAFEALEADAREELISTWTRGASFDLESIYDLESHAQRLPERWREALANTVDRERVNVRVGDERLSDVVAGLAVRGAAPAAGVRLSERIQRLQELDDSQRDTWFVHRGLGVFASIRDTVGRRKFIRLTSTLSERQREFLASIDVPETSDEWQRRAVELLVALADHTLEEQLRRLGIYLVALAEANALSGAALEEIRTHWGHGTVAILVAYLESIERSSRRHLQQECAAILASMEGKRD